jgi:putative two-component system response regulator
VTGYRKKDITGLRAGILKSGLTPIKTYEMMKETIGRLKPWSGVFINRKRNGELWHSHITITPFQVEDEVYYLGVFRNLSEINEGMYVSEFRKNKIQNEILRVLALSCEIRDPEIENHLSRVQRLTARFLHAYNVYCKGVLTEEYIQRIVNASIMHDIGKSGIPDGILYKPGSLTVYERAIIETHPLIGADILSKISSELDDELFRQDMITAREIVLYHHEKWDGTGYPHKLKGNEIPFAAQVVSIVDVYDALTSRRAYKDAWTQIQAAAYLNEQKGKAFQPYLVDIFLSMLGIDLQDLVR